MGCEINILRITEYIKEMMRIKEHKDLWIMFVDLKSAFDTVNHRILFEKIETLGINEEVVNTIKWIYR